MEETKKHIEPTGREAVTWLLSWLDSGVQEAGELFDQWARRRRYRYEGEHKLAEEREQVHRAFQKRIAYLKRKKLIKTKKSERRLLLELSDLGRTELMKREIQHCPKLPRGEVCLVMYDVPTEGNLGRDALRYCLKKIGFKQVQKSVWSIDKDVGSIVSSFVQQANIQTWVEVYRARKE